MSASSTTSRSASSTVPSASAKAPAANATSFTGSVPASYHKHLGPMLFEPYARDVASRIKQLSLAPNARVLELAGGTGIVTKHILAGLPANASLVATDINEAMLDVAKTYVGADPRVTYQKVDACSIPFADQSFDLIVCQYGVMFFPDKVLAMKEARRVLKPGGRYIFNIWDSLEHNPLSRTAQEAANTFYPSNPPNFLAQVPYGWSDRAEIERVTRAGGFTNVKLDTVEFPTSSPSALDAATGLINGTPVFAALKDRGMTDTTPVVQAAAKALAQTCGDNPCRGSLRAIVATAW